MRLNQHLRPSSRNSFETFGVFPDGKKTYCMPAMREVASLEEAFAPLLQSSTLSDLLVLELRGGVAMQWSI